MSERAAEKRLYTLEMVPDRYKTQEIHNIVV